MAKKVGKQLREDMERLIDEYFFHPTKKSVSFMEDISKATPDRRLDVMTRLYQICSKEKQDINVELNMFDEVSVRGKRGMKLDE
jgi:hypothetical protein